MLRSYRNIARDNNLMALGSGQSQAIGESILVKTFHYNFRYPYQVELVPFIKLGGF